MKRIGIIAKPHKPEARTVLQEMVPWIVARGVEPVLDVDTADLGRDGRGSAQVGSPRACGPPPGPGGRRDALVGGPPGWSAGCADPRGQPWRPRVS